MTQNILKRLTRSRSIIYAVFLVSLAFQPPIAAPGTLIHRAFNEKYTWTLQEKWVWQSILSGQVANLQTRFPSDQGFCSKVCDNTGGPFEKDTALVAGKRANCANHCLSPLRSLRPEFIQQILTENAFKQKTPVQGVRIIGAVFEKPINLDGAELDHEFWCKNCFFEGGIYSPDMTARSINLSGSTVTNLDMERSHLSGYFFMRDQSVVENANLSGMQIDGQLDFENAISHNINLSTSRLEGGVVFSNSHIDNLSLYSSNTSGGIAMNGLAISTGLNLRYLISRGPIFLSDNAKVKNLDISGADVTAVNISNFQAIQNIDMQGSHIHGDIVGREVKANKILLRNSVIDGTLDLSKAGVANEINLEGALIHGNLIGDGATFNTTNLMETTIGQQLNLDNSTITGELDMQNAKIGEHFLLRHATVKKSATLIYLNVAGDLQLDASHLSTIDLTGANIGHTLRLGAEDQKWKAPTWQNDAELILLNASVHEIQDREEKCSDNVTCKGNAWPRLLDLRGFQYESLVGVSAAESNDMGMRDSDWWINWLAREKYFSPNSYRQLSDTFNAIGQQGKADDITYAEKSREGDNLLARGEYFRALVNSIQWIFTGYAIGYHLITHTAFFVVFLVSMGVFILRLSGMAETFDLPKYPFAFSFDLLIPIVKLDESHYQIPLTGFAKRYFYFHKMMGYILAAFIAGAIASITK